MFETLHSLLPKSLRRHDVYDNVQAALLLRRIKNYYAQVLPHVKVEPFVVKRNKAFVGVSSSLLASECYRYMEGCMEALHTEGFDLEGIQFRVTQKFD